MSAVLKKYVDNSYLNADFILQNPTFYNPSEYYPNMKDVKGKMIKRTMEKFVLNEVGKKIYGDSDIREYQTVYYIFDTNGHITDSYFISLAEDGYIFSKYHKRFSFVNDKYTINTLDMKNKSEKIEEYSVYEDNNKLVFSKTEKKKCYIIIFDNDKIQYQTYKNENLDNETIYHLDKDSVFVETFWYDKAEKIKNYDETYNKGAINNRINYLNDGTIKSKILYESKSNTRTYLEKKDNEFHKKSVHKFERKYTGNLLVEDNLLPMSEEGEYNITHTDILSKYDDFYLEYFQ